MYRTHTPSRRGSVFTRRAFTLAEALLAATILSIVSASAVLPFLAGSQQVNEAARLEQAVTLGQALMEEILARPFSDATGPSPGPEAGETSRNLYDNIDDFNGYSEATGDVRNFQNASTATDATNHFWRQVSVSYVSFPALGQQASDTNSFALVEVRVYSGTTLLVTLDRIATREN